MMSIFRLTALAVTLAPFSASAVMNLPDSYPPIFLDPPYSPISDNCAEQMSYSDLRKSSAREMIKSPAVVACQTGTPTGQASFGISDLGFDAIGNHLTEYREASGEQVVSIAPATLRFMQANSMATPSQANTIPTLTNGLWFKAFGHQAKHDTEAAFSGYKSDGHGLTIGLDHRIDASTLVGAAVTASSTELSQLNPAQAASSDIQSYQGTLYANHQRANWFIDGLVGYTHQLTKSTRTSGIGQADARFTSDVYNARVTLGKRLLHTASNTVITPFASLQYDYLNRDAYQETGVGAVTVNKSNASRLTSGLGARLQKSFDVGNRSLSTSLGAQWLHEYLQDGLNASGNAGLATFLTPGQDPVEDIARLDTSISTALGSSSHLRLGYQYDVASHYNSNYYELAFENWF